MGIKQVIIVRKDLDMRKGKLASQCAHASIAFLHRQIDVVHHHVSLSEVQKQWLDGNYAKVVLWVADADEFHAVVANAQHAGLVVHPIQDEGRTDFHGVPTWTTAGIGPDTDERLAPITGHLKLVG